MTTSGSSAPRRDLSLLLPAETVESTLTIQWGSPTVFVLPGGLAFEPMRAMLRTRLLPQKAELAGISVRLDITQATLALFDIRRLCTFFKDELAIDVIGMVCPPETLQRYTERELKLKIHLVMPEPPPPPPPVRVEVPVIVEVPVPRVEVKVEPPPPRPTVVEVVEEPLGDRVMLVDYTLRSGTVLTFAGDVHVYGDVNPGAQIVAGGNVVVFGSLKGQVHAGNRHDRAFVMAFDMRPTLLKIGRAQLAGTRDPNQTGRFAPEIAWLSNGNIVVEPYKGRLPVKEVQ